MKLTEFDITKHLDSEEAIGDVTKARGMTHIAELSGLSRESLYKALAPGAHPRHETIQKVVHALGLKMTFTPIAAQ